MGSKEIWNLKYRQGFAFIGTTGKSGCIEKRSDEKEKAVVTQIFQAGANDSDQQPDSDGSVSPYAVPEDQFDIEN